jgi:hypothetical protein
MRISLIVCTGLLAVATAAQCEPSKIPQPAQPQRRTGEIVLASADVQAPAAPAVQATPAKRRIVRVTTCRCGDPQATSETPED